MKGLRSRSRAPLASMKVPPKRKGNWSHRMDDPEFILGLNESPSEKEGKLQQPEPEPARS